MTMITPNLVKYNDQYYEMVRPGGLNRPSDFGLHPPNFATTNNPEGFLCTYVLEQGKLSLESITCSHSDARPGGLFRKLLMPFKAYPPRINGISPDIDKSRNEMHYSNLALPLEKFTGNIIMGIGDSRDQDAGIDLDNDYTFAELLTIAIVNGNVISVDRVEGKASPPSTSRLIRTHSSLQDFPKKIK